MVEENLEKFHWTPLECTGRDSKRVNIESILTLEGLRNGNYFACVFRGGVFQALNVFLNTLCVAGS